MSTKPVRAARVTDTTGTLSWTPKATNTVKNDVFEHFSNIQRKIHINLSGGFGRGSGGGIPAVQQKGRRQGRRAYITFGYQPKASGKDTGPWPAPGFKRLTPDSRAPAKQGEGVCATVTLSGKAEAKKVVAEDVCEHKLRNILFHSLSLSFSLSLSLPFPSLFASVSVPVSVAVLVGSCLCLCLCVG